MTDLRMLGKPVKRGVTWEVTRNRKKRDNPAVIDVTLKDFADAQVSSSRLKKNIKNREPQEAPPDDESLEEKKPNKQARRRLAIKTAKANETDLTKDQTGIDYHIDVYFLIAEHLPLEAIGKFSVLCKTALAVTKSAKFWFDLCRRFNINKYDVLPLHGMRTRVVCNLYRNHPPFIERLSMNVYRKIERRHLDVDNKLDSLKGMYCDWVRWNCIDKDQWSCHIKLVDQIVKKRIRPIDEDEDVCAFPDGIFKTLSIVTSSYTPLPMVYGQVLKTITKGFTNSNTQNCKTLTLEFINGFAALDKLSISFFNPKTVRVLDWWENPGYGLKSHDK